MTPPHQPEPEMVPNEHLWNVIEALHDKMCDSYYCLTSSEQRLIHIRIMYRKIEPAICCDGLTAEQWKAKYNAQAEALRLAIDLLKQGSELIDSLELPRPDDEQGTTKEWNQYTREVEKYEKEVVVWKNKLQSLLTPPASQPQTKENP